MSERNGRKPPDTEDLSEWSAYLDDTVGALDSELTPYLRGEDDEPTRHEIYRVSILFTLDEGILEDIDEVRYTYLRPTEVEVFNRIEGVGVYENANEQLADLPLEHKRCACCQMRRAEDEFRGAPNEKHSVCMVCENEQALKRAA